ncbi:hypothetical protein VTH06DRAFT_94 [Thermothelomyces fergusii]
MAVQGHLVRFELQGPPLMSSVFCKPVSIGGPQGSGLDFPVWPILVPAADGFQVCYTDDEDLRDTYLQRGFCGLDAALRDQFDHDCHKRAGGYVATTVKHEKSGKSKQTSQEDELSQKRESRSLQNDQDEENMPQAVFEPFSIFGYFSLPAPRFLMKTMRRMRPHADKLSESTVTLFEVMYYFNFFATPVLGLFLLVVMGIAGAVTLIMEILGLISPDVVDRPNRSKRVPVTAGRSSAAAAMTTAASTMTEATTSPVLRPRVATTTAAAAGAAASPTVDTPTGQAARANHSRISDEEKDKEDDGVGKDESFELVPKMPSTKAADANAVSNTNADDNGIATVETWRWRQQQLQRLQQLQRQRNVRAQSLNN